LTGETEPAIVAIVMSTSKEIQEIRLIEEQYPTPLFGHCYQSSNRADTGFEEFLRHIKMLPDPSWQQIIMVMRLHKEKAVFE
jgi:hypothetical protein